MVNQRRMTIDELRGITKKRTTQVEETRARTVNEEGDTLEGEETRILKRITRETQQRKRKREKVKPTTEIHSTEC